ncbi:MAG: ABC transporter permease [Bacteroidota bacterium]|jgi:lipopolysaccharide transport system permease protein
METKVYTSTKGYNLLGVLKESLNGFSSSFYLAKQLSRRDISTQYRQSLLGVFWSFFPTLLSASIWILLNSTGTINLAATDIPYPLFVLIGTTVWSIFIDCLLMTVNSVNSNKSIITKVNFEKEALISLGLIKLFFNSGIKLVMVIFLMLFYQIPVSMSILWFIPLLLMSILLFVSLGIIITPLAMLYLDVSKFVPVAMQIFMYVTPVVYGMPKSGVMRTVMQFNPLTYLVASIRNSLSGFPVEDGIIILSIGVFAIFTGCLSLVIYRVAMPIIIERMSS